MAYFLFKCWHEKLFSIKSANVALQESDLELHMIPITGAMEGMTPPLALCMYTAMGIAGSKFKETTLNCLIWVGIHYLLSVICLLGLLPILGI